MHATEIVLPGIGEPESLQIRARELNPPGPGQAVVRVEATGISFAEQQMRRGKYYDQPRFPFVPGYDLVGVVAQPGAGAPSEGERVAALTKTGGWASHVLLDAADLVPVPDGVDAAAAETIVVNGLTAWRTLHRTAGVRRGQSIVVLGAAGGVGSTLVQLARHAGIHVIGTAGPAQQDRLRELGATAIDYRSDEVTVRVRELAPDGVAAVFHHIGGKGIRDSWRMLGRGGTLVSYGTASTLDEPGNPRLPVAELLARLFAWNALPNGRHAHFFNLWAGRRLRPRRYRAELARDLGRVLALLANGAISPQIAREFPLTDAAAALRYSEAGGITGKVVLIPKPTRSTPPQQRTTPCPTRPPTQAPPTPRSRSRGATSGTATSPSPTGSSPKTSSPTPAPLTGTGEDEIHGRDALNQWVSGINTLLPDLSFTIEVGPIATDEYMIDRFSHANR
jgi:NADPH2:quinone reductase